MSNHDEQKIAAEPLGSLLEQWTAALVQVLESMADQKARIAWQPGPAPEREPEQIWWEQPLQIAADMTVWVAAPRATWEHTGTVTLKSAGLESVELVEARNTYIEILGQSLSALARSIGATLGREVTCGHGEERAPASIPETGAFVTLNLSESEADRMWVGFSPKLIAVLSVPPEGRKNEECETGKSPDAQLVRQERQPVPPTMDLLLEVELPVSISFGKTELRMKDVLKLTTGSIVELNRGVNEPVEVLVNHCLIARGEVVVVEGNYGVRIQHIASRQDRLRSLR
jgi:flagellar motor switch protein FliN/FliY